MLPKIHQTRVFLALFFVMLTLVGVWTIRDYGASYDELTEMIILGSAVKEYALCLEGDDSTSYYATMNVERMRDSIEKDHGICAYYPLIPLFGKMDGNIRLASYVWSLLTWGWFMLGCVSLYGCLRELRITRGIACIGVLFLYLCPRFFAEGHYNNKDVVLLSFFLLTLWQGARFLRKPCLVHGLLFSIAGAMATHTKIIGIVPWCMIGLAMIGVTSVKREWSIKRVWIGIATITSFVLAYMLLTPAMWSDPFGFIAYLVNNATAFSRFGGTVIFRGATFYDVSGATPLPWYYIPYLILVTIPLYMLALTAVGQCLTLRSFLNKEAWKQEQAWTLLAVTGSYLVPLLYVMIRTPILYNGWRHFYFCYAGMVIMAGYGVHLLWQWAQKQKGRKHVAIVLMISCLLFTSVGLVQNRYYQFAYYNPLISRDAKHTMEMDYWNIAAAGAFNELYEQKAELEEEIRVGCYFNDIKVGTFKIDDDVYEKITVTVEEDEKYLYYGSTYAHIYGAKEPLDGYRVLFPLMSYGNTVGVVYEREGVTQ